MVTIMIEVGLMCILRLCSSKESVLPLPAPKRRASVR